MSHIPLQGLGPRDPHNILSEAARRRISDAYAEADLIRTRALASIEMRYRSQPESGKTLFDYQTTGQTGVEWAEAKIRAARVVLFTIRDEFQKAGTSGWDLREIMQDEVV